MSMTGKEKVWEPCLDISVDAHMSACPDVHMQTSLLMQPTGALLSAAHYYRDAGIENIRLAAS